MSIYGLLIGISIVFSLEQINKVLGASIKYIDYILLLVLSLTFSRALFLLHNIPEIREDTINPLSISDGGLTVYGALVGLLLALFVISKYRKISYLKLTDTFLLYIPLIQAIGRWGNFFNSELYGKPTTLPWGIDIPLENRLPGYEQFEKFHPVFLYESVLNLFNFLFLRNISKRELPQGTVTSLFLLIYGLIRICMNMIRIDKEYFLSMETSDIFSILFILTGTLLLTSIFRQRS